jgi:hypothetical protein
MWQVYVNPETKQIDVFTEDGHELKHLTNLTIEMDWAWNNEGANAKEGYVMLKVNGVAKIVFEPPKKNNNPVERKEIKTPPIIPVTDAELGA